LLHISDFGTVKGDTGWFEVGEGINFELEDFPLISAKFNFLIIDLTLFIEIQEN